MVASKGTAVMQIGGNSAIAEHTGKFMGICSGIDLDISENVGLLLVPYWCKRLVAAQPQSMLTVAAMMQIAGSPAVAANTGKFMGIRNGIDLDIWDPENDGLLPLPYTASNVVEVSQSISYASAIHAAMHSDIRCKLMGICSGIDPET